MDIGTAPAVNDMFLDIKTGTTPNRAIPTSDGLPERATRYGFVPMAALHDLPANAFKLQTFPAMRFVPFRVFEFPITTANNPSGLEFRERTPSEQVKDLYNIAGQNFAVDFPEIAALEDEAAAKEIFALLTNPNQCTKYPYELANACATCWLDYLRGDAPAKVADTYATAPQMFEAAATSLRKLVTSLEGAIERARAEVNKALQDVDNPKIGKDAFYDQDYVHIFNTHQDRPQFKTTTGQGTQLGDEFAKAIDRLMSNRTQDVGLSVDTVKQMIAESASAQSDELARLRAENEALKGAASVVTGNTTGTAQSQITAPAFSFKKGDTVLYQGKFATITADQFGKFTLDVDGETVKSVEKSEVAAYVQA